MTMAGERIVMIEDDEEMIALGELVLARHGYVVLSATNGQAGLKLLREQQADLVLLDIMMDGMDGWEVLEQIRSDDRLVKIPVVMLSARHYLEDEQETARHAGQYMGYIVKPFVVQELVQQVEQVLAARSRS
jgi:CheY-like chemotaxis protein